jgi:predicted polyphosphate/ATP-dependent NAD kinase
MAGASPPPRVGFVVNPIAGMGGPVALKGTDGPDAVRLARERGAVPIAGGRARRALEALVDREMVHVLAARGQMGAEPAAGSGVACEVTAAAPSGADTRAEDTRHAVREMCDRGIDLLLFAGGDGTARDILDAVDGAVPVVGVPTGVKMHSGVFATSPATAGAAAAAFLADPRPERLREAEVADVDEAAAREDRVATRLYGALRVPREPALMLGAKSGSGTADAGLEALAEELASTLPPDRLTLFGPGTSTAAVLARSGLHGTLLGVDAVHGGNLVGRDLDERALLELLDHYGARDAMLVCGVVGGQGALFGRGNQQLSPAVLRRLDRDRIYIIAAADKLLRLDPPRLRVDTGDDALDRELAGYVRVHVAPGQSHVMKVST